MATIKPKTKPQPAKTTSPGLARLEQQLGPEQSEALRQKTVGDQRNALAAVAPIPTDDGGGPTTPSMSRGKRT